MLDLDSLEVIKKEYVEYGIELTGMSEDRSFTIFIEDNLLIQFAEEGYTAEIGYLARLALEQHDLAYTDETGTYSWNSFIARPELRPLCQRLFPDHELWKWYQKLEEK